MKTSTGKPVTHATLLQDLLDSIHLPQAIAVCRCKAHTWGTDPVSQRNALTGKAAKEAAKQQQNNNKEVNHTVLIDQQHAETTQEKETWKKKGTLQDKDGIIKWPEEKPIFPKSMYKWSAVMSHGPCHVSTGGMMALVQHYTAYGLNIYFKIYSFIYLFLLVVHTFLMQLRMDMMWPLLCNNWKCYKMLWVRTTKQTTTAGCHGFQVHGRVFFVKLLTLVLIALAVFAIIICCVVSCLLYPVLCLYFTPGFWAQH